MKIKTANKGFKSIIVNIAVLLTVFFLMKTSVYGYSTTKIHYITVNLPNNVTLIESAGHFGIIDSGESDDVSYYPDGTENFYKGFDKQVISYMEEAGVTEDNLDFYIGTHPHSDHIGSAAAVILKFKPDRLYTPEYKDSYIMKSDFYSHPETRLWDNQFHYDRMLKAAKQVGTEVIMDFDDSNTSFELGDAHIKLFNTDMSYRTDEKGIRDANEISLGVKITSKEGVSAFSGGDMCNYFGDEDRAWAGIGKVSMTNLNHHGYYGSNSHDYLMNLSPEIIVAGNNRVYSSTIPEPMNKVHNAYENLSQLMNGGTKVYSTGAYNGKINALVFELDENLTNNLPSGTYDVLEVLEDGTYNSKYYTMKDGEVLKDGLKTGRDGSWSGKAGDRSFVLKDGSLVKAQVAQIDGRSYKFDNNGKLVNGLISDNDGWRFYVDGIAKTRWVEFEGKTYYMNPEDGLMAKGRQTIGKYTYYFKKNGEMAVNEFIDSQYFDKSGHLKDGKWVKKGSKWQYSYGSDAYAKNMVLTLDSGRYSFDKDGYMETGWKKLDGKWHWFGDSGAMVSGKWIKPGSAWYYIDSEGVMVSSGWNQINGNWYWFADNGAMAKDKWIKNESRWYYVTSSGAMATSGWNKAGGRWYWFSDMGTMEADRWIQSGSTWYYVTSSGAMASSGWSEVNGRWYWFSDMGTMEADRWIQSGSTWYYVTSSGAMATERWIKSGSTWYYVNANGVMASSCWKKLGGKWYWFQENGAMAKDTYVGKYHLGCDGAMID